MPAIGCGGAAGGGVSRRGHSGSSIAGNFGCPPGRTAMRQFPAPIRPPKSTKRTCKAGPSGSKAPFATVRTYSEEPGLKDQRQRKRAVDQLDSALDSNIRGRSSNRFGRATSDKNGHSKLPCFLGARDEGRSSPRKRTTTMLMRSSQSRSLSRVIATSYDLSALVRRLPLRKGCKK